jgi:pantothenate synthetase
LENVPCLFRTKGASFLNFTNEVINGCSAKNLSFQQVESTLTTQRHKKGSVTYFTPHFDPDFSNILDIGEKDVETMKYILSMIKDTNDQIRTKHDDAIRAKNNVATEAVVDDAISAEFSEVEEELGF